MKKILRTAYDTMWHIKNSVCPSLSLQQIGFVRKLLLLLLSYKTPKYIHDIHGHKILIDEIDSLNLSRDTNYEPLATEFFTSFLKPGMVVLDIGANIGYFSLLFSKLIGQSGKLLAFEPDPKNYQLLKKNIEINGYAERVMLYECALYKEKSELCLYLCDTNCGDHRIYDSGKKSKHITVKAETLDGIMSEHDCRIDCMKMDVQGSEFFVLQGMQKQLQLNPDLIIFTEYWPRGLHLSGVKCKSFFEFLEEKGFFPFEFSSSGHIEPTGFEQLNKSYTAENNLYTNLVFKRKILQDVEKCPEARRVKS